MIHSQKTSNINEPTYFNSKRDITYRNLNEALKYAEALKLANANDSIQQVQIKIKDSIIQKLREVNDTYKFDIVPNLKHHISLLEQKEVSQSELWSIKNEKWEIKYSKLKSKRFGFGFSAGYGAATTGLSPFVGVSVNYTIIRF